MSSPNPIIFNIQKFSTHDGPGVRTTIFFKGCPLRCAWCHNPESQQFEPETMLNAAGEPETIGRPYTLDDLLTIIQADQLFYDQSGGGVTFSGGEVMSQNRTYVVELAKRCRAIGITVAVDTCGVAQAADYLALLPHVDYFLYDLKFLDDRMHRTYTGASNQLVLENLQVLQAHRAPIILRLILVAGLNDSTATAKKTIAWLQAAGITPLEISLLPYHAYGSEKYPRLHRAKPTAFQVPTAEQLAIIQTLYEKAGYVVKIGG
jgi:pyruvate formate lyase activating enzyme